MNRPKPSPLTAILFAFTNLLACGSQDAAQDPAAQDPALAWDSFRAKVYREPQTGAFIVDGDTPVFGEVALRAFYDSLVSERAQDAGSIGVRRQGLAVFNIGGTDIRWSDAQRMNLTYSGQCWRLILQ